MQYFATNFLTYIYSQLFAIFCGFFATELKASNILTCIYINYLQYFVGFFAIEFKACTFRHVLSVAMYLQYFEDILQQSYTVLSEN